MNENIDWCHHDSSTLRQDIKKLLNNETDIEYWKRQYLELSKENEQLKLNHKQKKDLEKTQVAINKLLKENQQLKKEIDKLTAESTEFESKYYQLQEINEKAKEYIKNCSRELLQTYNDKPNLDFLGNVYELLNILNGDDK